MYNFLDSKVPCCCVPAVGIAYYRLWVTSYNKFQPLRNIHIRNYSLHLGSLFCHLQTSLLDILETEESYPQYPWLNLYKWRINEISVTGTAYPHRYCIPSRVLRIWLMGAAYPHWYWGYDSRVLRIWLTGTEDMTHGYCISFTGTEDMTHGYWSYDSWVMIIWFTGTDHMTHGYCI